MNKLQRQHSLYYYLVRLHIRNMFKISSLLVISDFLPIFPFSFGRSKRLQNLRKIITAPLLLISIYAIVYSIENVTDMSTFSTNCVRILVTMSISYLFVHICLGKDESLLYHPTLTALINTTEDMEANWSQVLACILQLAYFMDITYDVCYRASNLGLEAVGSITACFLTGSLCQFILIKNMVIKRLNTAQRNLMVSETVLDHFSELRSLIDINDDVNEVYSALMTLLSLTHVAGLMNNIVYLWLLSQNSGLNVIQWLYLGRTVIRNCLWLLVAHKSSQVPTLMDNIKAELDRVISCQSNHLTYRMQILTLLQELDNFPSALQCLEFYSVEGSSVTSIVDLAVSFLSVNIQFVRG
jgi:hypothetical protein